MGVRAARGITGERNRQVKQLAMDGDPQVRRECALALRHHREPEAARLWAN